MVALGWSNTCTPVEVTIATLSSIDSKLLGLRSDDVSLCLLSTWSNDGVFSRELLTSSKLSGGLEGLYF